MTRIEQQRINAKCYLHFNEAIAELPIEARSYLNTKQKKALGAEQLRTCSAFVWETNHYWVLQSYETFVACIDKRTDICYDVLRTEYGYTATSAKHISIFRKNSLYGGYGSGICGVKKEYTAR